MHASNPAAWPRSSPKLLIAAEIIRRSVLAGPGDRGQVWGCPTSVTSCANAPQASEASRTSGEASAAPGRGGALLPCLGAGLFRDWRPLADWPGKNSTPACLDPVFVCNDGVLRPMKHLARDAVPSDMLRTEA